MKQQKQSKPHEGWRSNREMSSVLINGSATESCKKTYIEPIATRLAVSHPFFAFPEALISWFLKASRGFASPPRYSECTYKTFGLGKPHIVFHFLVNELISD